MSETTTQTITQDELWRRTADALDKGDFTLLDDLLNEYGASIIDILEENGQPKDLLGEAFAWACFTGRTHDAEILLDKGVDPADSIKTGLAGFHWAANRGHLDTVNLLIARHAPLEQINMYGGSVLNCSLYSIVHEHKESHADIIEALITAGAAIDPGTLDWLENQNVPSPEAKRQVAEALKKAV